MCRHRLWNTKHKNMVSCDSTGPLANPAFFFRDHPPTLPCEDLGPEGNHRLAFCARIASISACCRPDSNFHLALSSCCQVSTSCATQFYCRWLQFWTSHLCPLRLGHDVYICTSVYKSVLQDKTAVIISVAFTIITAQIVRTDVIQITQIDMSLPLTLMST